MAHEYSCGECAFRIRSEDDDEIIELVQDHAMDKHDTDVSRSDVQDGWQEVSAD